MPRELRLLDFWEAIVRVAQFKRESAAAAGELAEVYAHALDLGEGGLTQLGQKLQAVLMSLRKHPASPTRRH